MLVFPTSLFRVNEKDIDFDLPMLSGGTALTGAQDRIHPTGGATWYGDLSNVLLGPRDRMMAWRAFKSATNGGADPFIFPICDARHQPVTGVTLTTFSDGASFDDDTLFQQSDSSVQAASAAALRATTIDISIAQLGRPLVGGERFTIVHPVWRDRCYQIGQIFDLTDTSATIQFHPPLREAITESTNIDFANPRFVASIDDDMSAPLSNPKFGSGSISVVEDMSGVYT